MKYDEYDIQTACNIATGDDETTGKEVIRILKIITKEEEKENDRVWNTRILESIKAKGEGGRPGWEELFHLR